MLTSSSYLLRVSNTPYLNTKVTMTCNHKNSTKLRKKFHLLIISVPIGVQNFKCKYLNTQKIYIYILYIYIYIYVYCSDDNVVKQECSMTTEQDKTRYWNK